MIGVPHEAATFGGESASPIRPNEAARALAQELDHPPGKVWAALADRRLLAGWFLPCEPGAEGEGHVGRTASFSLAMPRHEGDEGRIDCEVVELEPGRRLVLTWRSHRDRDLRPAAAVDALVTFELDVTPCGRTRLRLRQAALPALLRGTVVMLRPSAIGLQGRRPPAMSAATLLPLAA